jgi:O-antigen/teichoic acid export membrane protein
VLVDQAVVSGGNFLFAIFAARALGLAEFGQFSTAWLAVLLLNSFHMAAIVLPMLTLSAELTDEELPGYFSCVLGLQHLFNAATVAVCLAAAAVAAVWSAQVVHGVLLVAATAVAFHLQEFYRRYFFCAQQPSRAIAVDAVAYGGRFLVLAAILAADGGVSVATVMLSMTSAYLAACVFGRLLRPRLPKPCRDTGRTWRSRQWQQAKYLLPSAVMQWLSINLHLGAAVFVLGTEAVGVIRLGQTLVNAGNVYLQALENILPLRFAKARRSGGVQAALRDWASMLRRGCGGVLAAGAVLSIFAEPLMAFLFGETTRRYGYVVYWFVPIFLLALVQVHVRVALRSLDQTRWWFRGYIASTVVSLLVFLPAQRLLDVSGVLLGILVSYLVVIVVAWLPLRRMDGAPCAK